MNDNVRYTHRMRALLAAILLALGFVGVATTATSSSASAATGSWFCVEINGELECVWIPYAINWKDLLCPGCPPEFTLEHEHLVIPELEQVVAGEVARGVSDLLVAQLTGDRVARDSGLAHLERGAVLGGEGFVTGRPEPGPWVGRPDPDPWVETFEQDLVDGLNLLQEAATTRDSAVAGRLSAAAISELDGAIATLQEHATVG